MNDIVSMRFPVKDTSGRPTCFALSFSDDHICRKCKFKLACEEKCHVWAERLSLSEHLQKAEDRLKFQDKDVSIQTRYAELLKQHYGIKLHEKQLEQNPRTFKSFKWVLEYCDKNEIDITLWITAQMHVLSRFIKMKRIMFQPTMLCGEKAIRRYNIHVRVTNRRYKRSRADAMDSAKDMMRLLARLTESEERVATSFVISSLTTKPITWSQAVDFVRPCSEWYTLHGLQLPAGYIDSKAELLEKFTDKDLNMMREIATLRAACNVAAWYHFKLSDRIGFKHFTWVGFAKIIGQTFSIKDKIEAQTEALNIGEGFEWRALSNGNRGS